MQNCAAEIVETLCASGSSVSTSAQRIVDTFNEIASDVIASNKTELIDIKKEIKDSGYSDKIAKSIVSTNKSRLEAQEKRLRNGLLLEFLDVLEQEFVASDSLNSSFIVSTFGTINEYKKRLVFNPSEMLYLESMFSSIMSVKFQVNS